MKEKQITI